MSATTIINSLLTEIGVFIIELTVKFCTDSVCKFLVKQLVYYREGQLLKITNVVLP